MDNSNKIGIMLYAIMCCIFLSCNFSNKSDTTYQDQKPPKANSFYENSRREDLFRIPLIEPYEIISADGGYSWYIKFLYPQKIFNKHDLGSIDSVGLKNNIIVIFSSSTYLPGEMTQAWFVLDVNKKDEVVFKSREFYNNYLLKNNLKDIKFYPPQSIFPSFDRGGKLPW